MPKTKGKSALSIVQKYYPSVLKVIDAPNSVSIAVTSRDCQLSKSKAPDACAMAHACKRSYDGAIIALSTAYLIKGTKAFRYKVPEAVSREIVSFDRHHDFQPGTYSLNAPTKWEKLAPRKYRLNPDRHKKSYPLVKARSHRTAGIRSI